MVSDDRVARSKAIQRQTGRTFHLATRVLPGRGRHPTRAWGGHPPRDVAPSCPRPAAGGSRPGGTGDAKGGGAAAPATG